MAKQSAGILLYRRHENRLQIFLVHPGGPWWANKDQHAWTIPKGEIQAEESPLETARREFEEETGHMPPGEGFWLSPVKQPGGKTVHALAAKGDLDPERIKSNSFSLEWPPRSGQQASFSEIDKAGWFSLAEAEEKINTGQIPLLAELEQALEGRAGTSRD